MKTISPPTPVVENNNWEADVICEKFAIGCKAVLRVEHKDVFAITVESGILSNKVVATICPHCRTQINVSAVEARKIVGKVQSRAEYLRSQEAQVFSELKSNTEDWSACSQRLAEFGIDMESAPV